jgi:hypothetical protein
MLSASLSMDLAVTAKRQELGLERLPVPQKNWPCRGSNSTIQELTQDADIRARVRCLQQNVAAMAAIGSWARWKTIAYNNVEDDPLSEAQAHVVRIWAYVAIGPGAL